MRELIVEFISATGYKKFPVEWLDVQSLTGNFIIGPGHAPLISVLRKNGMLIYKKPGIDKQMELLSGGIIQVTASIVTLIID